MSESLTALASENLNSSLRSLLEDVQRGHILVPRFQRPFVWTDTQRIELLQSVRDNMPIGSLLVWRTIKFKLASFSIVGPHKIPDISESAPLTGWQYLLDGHQRVSTLLGLLLQAIDNNINNSDGESVDWDIRYDLMDEEFVFARKSGKKSEKHPLLPLWTLFDGRLVNKHMREVRKQAVLQNWNDSDLELWEARADQLSYRFQQCRIPIVVMVTDELELAAKTFQRINSLGTPMGEAHLVAALTWDTSFDMRERLAALRQELPFGWHSIDDGLFLQVCKGLCGLDMTKTGQSELIKRIKEDELLLDSAGALLKEAINWLSDQLGVVRQELLPYTFQLVLLAVELERWKGSKHSEDAAIKWFWRTGWSEVFASASYRQVKTELENLRNSTDPSHVVSWSRDQDIPDRMDFRSARVRLLLLRLAKKTAPKDTCDPQQLLIKYGREALVKLFPTPKNASRSLILLLQGAGNRFLIDPSCESSFREALQNPMNLSPETLSWHFIDDDALNSLHQGDLEKFIHSRATAINSWDKSEWCSEKANGPQD